MLFDWPNGWWVNFQDGEFYQGITSFHSIVQM